MIHVYSSMQTANATIVHCLVTVFRSLLASFLLYMYERGTKLQ